MGHSEIGVTLNTYTHLDLKMPRMKPKRMEDLNNARNELIRIQEEKMVTQKMFRVIR